MSMFTLAISCLTTSNLPWFMNLTFQVPMQYYTLQHWTLLLSPVTSATGYCFCFGFIPSFYLELFLHWSQLAYWAPTNLGSSSFSILSICLFLLFLLFLRRNGVTIMVNKRVWNAVLGCNLKNDRMVSVHFQGEPFNITVIQAYAPTSNAEEAEVEWFYEDLQDLLGLTPKKHILLIIGYWNAKVGSQGTPGVTGQFGLGVRNEAGQRLIEFCQENALVIANTLFQKHKRPLYTWTSPDVQYQNQMIIFFAAKDGEALYSQRKQDQELTAQIMNSLLPNSDLNWRK